MAYIPGGQGYAQSVLLPNLIPHSNNYALAYISFPPSVLSFQNLFSEYLTQYNTGSYGMALPLAERQIQIGEIQHQLEYPVGRIYGNREVFGIPILRQDGSLQLEFIETRNPSPRDLFTKWASTIFSYARGVSDLYDVPAMHATIYIYNYAPDLSSILHKVTLFGAYPESIPEEPIAFDVTASEISKLTVTFKYTLAIPEIPPIVDDLGMQLAQAIFPTLNFSI